jgi:tetratricopeptide (TPR) repeat protein
MTDENNNSQPENDQSAGARSERFRQALNESALLLRSNRPGEAVRILESLRKELPDDPDLAINLGGALILQRKWNRAVAVLASAAKRHPDNPMLWTNLGAAHLGRLETAGPRQQDKAIMAYERALQIDPKAPNVHYHLGLIYKERGQLTRALAHFQRAVEVNPMDKDALYWVERMGQLLSEEQSQRSNDGSADPSGDATGNSQGDDPV